WRRERPADGAGGDRVAGAGGVRRGAGGGTGAARLRDGAGVQPRAAARAAVGQALSAAKSRVVSSAACLTAAMMRRAIALSFKRIFGSDRLMAATTRSSAARMGAPKQQPSSTLSSLSVEYPCSRT